MHDFHILWIDNPCQNNPCQNGATCTSNGDGYQYTCTCTQGYFGTTCSTCRYLFILALDATIYYGFIIVQFFLFSIR